MIRLADAVAVVTGGANGLGRSYCEAFARAGARVVVADLDGDNAEALAAELSGDSSSPRAVAVRADVTSEEDTAAVAEAALGAFGRIDVLVNNAGSYPHVAFEEIGFDEWRRVISVNLDSVYLCSRAVLGPMKAQARGSIINVATNLVWTGLAGMVHYVAAKAGVVGFTRAFAREVGPYGIRVNAVAPGAVVPDVAMTDASRERIDAIVAYQCLRRAERSDDLVGAVLFLASEASAFISGQVITVDGGLTTH